MGSSYVVGDVVATPGVMQKWLAKLPGVATASPVMFSAEPVPLNRAALVTAYKACGYSDAKAGQLADSLKPRAVYLGAGATESGLTLIFGPPGGTELSPLNDAVMRKALGRSPGKMYEMYSNEHTLIKPPVTVYHHHLGIDRFGWRTNLEGAFGGIVGSTGGYLEGGQLITGGSHTVGAGNVDSIKARAGWNGHALLGWTQSGLGGRVFGPDYPNANAIDASGLTHLLACGEVGPCIVWKSGSSSTLYVMDALSPVSTNRATDYTATGNAITRIFHSSASSYSMGSAVADAAQPFVLRVPFVSNPLPAHRNGWASGVEWPKPSMTFASNADAFIADRMLNGMTGARNFALAYGKVFDHGSLGSRYPFPMASIRFGYVWGLPGDFDVIQWVCDTVTGASPSSEKVVFSLKSAHADYRKDVLARLYPLQLSALTDDQRTRTRAMWAELPEGLVYRTAYIPSGLRYPEGVSYDKTKVYLDAERGDVSFGDTLYDNVDDTSPPLTYDALGALSLVAIQKGNNRFTTVPLTSDHESQVVAATISFSREGGVVVASIGGKSADAAAAQLQLKAGATPTFVAPLTDAEVATEFFEVATWAALVDILDTADVADYCVEEVVCTGDLMFDCCSQDQLARAIPLLLGFERGRTSACVGFTLVGVAPTEII